MMPRADFGCERRHRLARARLYFVCDATPGGRDLPAVLAQAIAGGVDIVQLREKHLDDEDLTVLARTARELCRELGALFIVNDRPAVALAAEADGVHVGQEDMPVARVREIVGMEMLVGLSTHAPAEIEISGCQQVDYLGVGPVNATPTKPGRPAVGLRLVGHAAAHAPHPFFAIGGIDTSNVAEVLEVGARRVAVVRAIAESEDPRAAAHALHAILDEHPLEDPDDGIR